MEFCVSLFRLIITVMGALAICSSSHENGVMGIRFELKKEECVFHFFPYESDNVQVSYVVIQTDTSWLAPNDDVDLEVTDPHNYLVYNDHDKTRDKFEFIVRKHGLHKFCFKHRSSRPKTIDFDIHVRHFHYYEQHAESEHLNPLFAQISKLEQALFEVQFEQHWLQAQTDRQAIVNQSMGRRAIYKAMLESVALVGASVLQIYLLQLLFERKLDTSRV